MNICIASYSFHGLLKEEKIDVFGYLESVKYRYHLNAADIWNGMLVSMEDDYLKKVRQALDERGLCLANLCVDGAHLWEPDAETREQNYRNALAHLHAAEVLGARTVRIDMGGRDTEMTEEQFEYTVKRYQEYTRRAQENGYMVGPENHWGASRVPTNIQKVYDAVDSPAFGILLHFENWDVDAQNGDQICAPYAFHTHLAAWVEPRYEEKLNMLADAGYKGYLGVEHHSAQNEYVQVAWQLASLQRTVALQAR
ncbi:sugar phosphate isomerase/epimerase family protein [Alicyclobacillus fodiniaquatilis]|uniref:Sugar phosphate isomerase/epimerase family protein n=1 Tax=Alicyclobacillus fodiniaquatilis TaxID=1661150 RepID=A0ABW4JPH8_9BACL